MSCDHLICAACAGPVIEGRCSVCRTARAHVHQGSTPFTLTPQLAVLLAATLALLVVLAMHLR